MTNKSDEKYNLLSFIDKHQEKELLETKLNVIWEQIKKHQAKYQRTAEGSYEEEMEFMKLQDLSEYESIIFGKITLLQEQCDHGLILYLGHNNQKQYAVCLECEKVLVYCEDEEVNLENMIDISDIIPSKYIWITDNNNSILATKAIEKILILAEYYSEMSLEEIKENVLESLIYYSDELEYQEIKPRKRKRIFE